MNVPLIILLIRKIYEDNVIGKLPDRLFQRMLTDYENELNKIIETDTADILTVAYRLWGKYHRDYGFYRNVRYKAWTGALAHKIFSSIRYVDEV